MAEKIYFVTASALNVRSEPSINGDKWELLHKGDRVIAAGDIVDGWLPILLEDDEVAYVSAKYVTEEKVQPEIHRGIIEYLASYIPASKEEPTAKVPVWLQWMIDKLGLQEVPGAGDNPEIIEWMKLTTLPRSMWHDSKSLCSVTVNAAFMLNGMEGTRSAAAVSWLKWGKKLTKGQLGAVVIFEWYNKNGDVSGHHVGIYLDETADKVQIIGGNQSDAITKQWYPKKNVIGYRWPNE